MGIGHLIIKLNSGKLWNLQHLLKHLICVAVLKMGSIGGSQRGKRRASGLGAEIEAK